MSQVTQITIDNVAFGTFRSNLNDTLNALNSMHSGTSRPTTATTGTIWLDTTNAGSNSLTIKFFDGTDDITVADVDTSANTINFIDSTVSADLINDLSPQLGGMLDVNGNAIGNGTEELIKFSETASAVNEITVTNSATGNAPEISATGDDTNIDLKLTPKGSGNLNLDGLIFPNADGTADQILKTDGSGNLSFVDAGGGGISSVNNVVIDSTSTYTPTSGTKFFEVYVCGGGGGGGGVDADSTGFEGGAAGGNGGNTTVKVFNATEMGASASVTIGSGGSGGPADGATAGGTGGNTTFAPAGTGSTITGTGGIGGISNDERDTYVIPASQEWNSSTGNGDYVIFGQIGHASESNVGVFNTPGYYVGGGGGASFLGQGASYILLGVNDKSGGRTDNSRGGGGGGAVCKNNVNSRAGGAGASGAVLIKEYA